MDQAKGRSRSKSKEYVDLQYYHCKENDHYRSRATHRARLALLGRAQPEK